MTDFATNVLSYAGNRDILSLLPSSDARKALCVTLSSRCHSVNGFVACPDAEPPARWHTDRAARGSPWGTDTGWQP